MHFQEDVEQHSAECLLDWRCSHLQLWRLLQSMVFHLQRCRVFRSSSHWWCSVHEIWKWQQTKEFASRTSYWRSLWENPQRHSGCWILGRQTCRSEICWCSHRLARSVPDLRGRNTSPTGLITADSDFLLTSSVINKLFLDNFGIIKKFKLWKEGWRV